VGQSIKEGNNVARKGRPEKKQAVFYEETGRGDGKAER
jgi:hypothetical protein